MDGKESLAAERFIAEARAAITESSRQHIDDWRLGSESRWEIDLSEGRVTFHFRDGMTLVAPIQIVGTYDPRNGTFLWAWAHETLPAALIEHARLARRWGRTHQVDDYTAAVVDCEADDVWSFAAVTARLAGRDGIFRGRSGALWMYMSYGELEWRVPQRSAGALTTMSRGSAAPVATHLPAVIQHRLGRFRAGVGSAVEERWHRLGSRFSDVVQRPVDCSRITSRLRLGLARQRGQLEPMTLMPPLPVVDQEAVRLNTVFVPPYFAEQKRRIDHLILRGLVRHGVSDPAYTATPDFAGRSLVPASIQIEVSGPVRCRTVMRIWDPEDGLEDESEGDLTADEDGADSRRGPETVPESIAGAPTDAGIDTAMHGAIEVTADAGFATPPAMARPAPIARSRPDEVVMLTARQPQSIVEAFIRDYFDWNAEAAQDADQLADGGDVSPERRERIHGEYRALLRRYCVADIGPGRIAWGGESIFDPVHSRIVAEVHIGERALVVVGRPVEAGSGRQFSTYDFEFVRDGDQWRLVDIAAVEGLDRLSMLGRRRQRTS